MDWMIYGATGYTGRLVAREAKRQGLSPILAGRDAQALSILAQELALPHRVVELDAPDLRRTVAGVSVVAHCAGPFSKTAAPMRAACIAAGTHYVDITGEIAAFEAAYAEDGAARAAGVVLCPGVGFDVIPTDCVAACLKEALPDATHLALGFETPMRMSRGTALTTIEGLAGHGAVRAGHAIRAVPMGILQRRIDFGAGERHAVAIPWGDISTAWHSTAIPDIAVYVPLPRAAATLWRAGRWLRPVLASAVVQGLLRASTRRIAGPDAAARAADITLVWGEATNANEKRCVARLTTGSVYDVTVNGVLAAVRRLLAGNVEAGFLTPSQLLGPRVIETFAGSSRITIDDGTA